MVSNLSKHHPDATIFSLDTNFLFTLVLDDPARFPETAGFLNTTAYCSKYARSVFSHHHPNSRLPILVAWSDTNNRQWHTNLDVLLSGMRHTGRGVLLAELFTSQLPHAQFYGITDHQVTGRLIERKWLERTHFEQRQIGSRWLFGISCLGQT